MELKKTETGGLSLYRVERVEIGDVVREIGVTRRMRAVASEVNS